MTFEEIVRKAKSEDLIPHAAALAVANKLSWNRGMMFVLIAATRFPKQSPTIKGSSFDEILLKWFYKYKSGYESRISKRKSKMPGTVSDPMVDKIIEARLPHLAEADLKKVRFGHRLGMSAENILGLLLEEYLALELEEFKWHCCWGQTMKSIDFVNENGPLLQIKNRSNSENSSSNKVRIGTKIKNWYRVDAKTGGYEWQALNTMNGTKKFSEAGFSQFVTETLATNPHALAIEDGNPWSQKV